MTFSALVRGALTTVVVLAATASPAGAANTTIWSSKRPFRTAEIHLEIVLNEDRTQIRAECGIHRGLLRLRRVRACNLFAEGGDQALTHTASIRPRWPLPTLGVAGARSIWIGYDCQPTARYAVEILFDIQRRVLRPALMQRQTRRGDGAYVCGRSGQRNLPAQRFEPSEEPFPPRSGTLVRKYHDQIVAAAQRNGLDPLLLGILIEHEGGNYELAGNAVAAYRALEERVQKQRLQRGSNVSVGIAQLQLGTARRHLDAADRGLSDRALLHKLIYDDAFSIAIASRHLRLLIDRHGLASRATDTSYKAFMAYAATDRLVDALNSYEWRFDELWRDVALGRFRVSRRSSEETVRSIETLIDRGRKYAYWENRLLR